VVSEVQEHKVASQEQERQPEQALERLGLVQEAKEASSVGMHCFCASGATVAMCTALQRLHCLIYTALLCLHCLALPALPCIACTALHRLHCLGCLMDWAVLFHPL
jgi:hypothetical protein